MSSVSFKDAVFFLVLVAAMVAGVVGLAYGANYLDLDILRRFGVARENVRTDIYRENKSYIEGTLRDLRDLHRQYEAATGEHKDAIRSLIQHRAGELDLDRLPADLKRFFEDEIQ